MISEGSLLKKDSENTSDERQENLLLREEEGAIRTKGEQLPMEHLGHGMVPSPGVSAAEGEGGVEENGGSSFATQESELASPLQMEFNDDKALVSCLVLVKQDDARYERIATLQTLDVTGISNMRKRMEVVEII